MWQLSKFPIHSVKSEMKSSDNPSTGFLLRAGFVRQEMAGVYSFLPMGLRVLEKIKTVVRQRLAEAGCFEISMPAIGPRERREKTGRHETVDVLFELPFSDGKNHFLNPTHEEIVTPLLGEFLHSYKNLPAAVFQFQTKFRNEKRAKSGLLRGREFLMKDLYSFHESAEDLEKFYEKMIGVYHQIFVDLGLGDETFLTVASGGAFAKYSHEFQTLLEIGEDKIFLDRAKKIAVNEEIIGDPSVEEDFGDAKFEEVAASEIGNIFKLGTRFSEAFGLEFTDRDGVRKPVWMGSYGIGVSRTMGIIAEKFCDERWLVWPAAVAPFDFVVLSIGDSVVDAAREIAEKLEKLGKSVLWDDRDAGFGMKAGDADLWGIPVRILVSEKSLAAGGIERKSRTSDAVEILGVEELLARVGSE